MNTVSDNSQSKYHTLNRVVKNLYNADVGMCCQICCSKRRIDKNVLPSITNAINFQYYPKCLVTINEMRKVIFFMTKNFNFVEMVAQASKP